MNPELPTFDQFFDGWELFRSAALAGAIAGALLGALGVYIVLRRLVFLSAALSQMAGLGVALALWLGFDPALGAIGAVTSAGAPFFSRRIVVARRDALMGLLWLAGAAGALAIGSRIEDHEEVEHLLFGSAVAVTDESLRALLVVAVIVLAIHLWWMRGFIAVAVDPDGARVRRLPVRVLELALLATLVFSISVATRTLGALPVFAFSVLPAFAALSVARTVPRAIGIATVLGAIAGFGGYLLAFRLALPVGPAQAIVAAALVVVAQLAGRALPWAGALRAQAQSQTSNTKNP